MKFQDLGRRLLVCVVEKQVELSSASQPRDHICPHSYLQLFSTKVWLSPFGINKEHLFYSKVCPIAEDVAKQTTSATLSLWEFSLERITIQFLCK